MEHVWGCVLLGALLSQAAALRCYSCDGPRSCEETEECGELQGQCRTTALTTIARERPPVPARPAPAPPRGAARPSAELSSPLPPGSGHFQRIQRGCDAADKPSASLSFLAHGRAVFLAEQRCATDLCNQAAPEAPSILPGQPHLECFSCASSDRSCAGPAWPRIRCWDPREQCVDITAVSLPQEFPQDEERIKGCGQITQCQEPLGFHNRDSFYLLQCCNASLCNNNTHDHLESPLPLNGAICYACEGNSSHGCAPENIAPVQCQGPMTHCLEAMGSHEVTGPGAVLKGCATPAWCDSPYTAVYKRLTGAQPRCCRGNFCNSWIQGGALPPARRSRASPGPPARPALLCAALLAALALQPGRP
ncbi:urokinase plasminogen activator surface receptor-like isoform X2 [Carettochelys insculpta]|uniref:urokinase plasminogen activator surface receptor-like isoform X2 n=1 Tax=Carettochelys insculpta TaxID=44489 RepID=UPI003EB75762